METHVDEVRRVKNLIMNSAFTLKFSSASTNIQDLEELCVLQIAFQDLKALAKICPKLYKFRVIDQITKQVFHEISKIKSLSHIYILFNHSLDGNILTECKNIKRFQISKDHLSSQDAQNIVKHLINLQHLSLFSQNLNPQTLASFSCLQGLNSLVLDTPMQQQHYSQISKFKYLKHLAIRRGQFTQQKLKTIPKTLSKLKSLAIEKFVQEEGGICEKGIELITLHCENLQSLSLVGNTISQQSNNMICNKLHKLKKIEGGIGYSDSYLMAISSRLTLTDLKLSDSQITCLGISYLVSLKQTLKVLNLSNCKQLNQESVKLISTFFNIQQLWLQQCEIVNNVGCFYLSKMKKLNTLGLNQNRIQDRGFLKILRNLKKCLLFFEQNPIQKKGKRNAKFLNWVTFI